MNYLCPNKVNCIVFQHPSRSLTHPRVPTVALSSEEREDEVVGIIPDEVGTLPIIVRPVTFPSFSSPSGLAFMTSESFDYRVTGLDFSTRKSKIRRFYLLPFIFLQPYPQLSQLYVIDGVHS